MAVVDASIRVFQTVFPSVMQNLGRAKDREVEAAGEEEEREISQTKAQLEVLVMKNQELIQDNRTLRFSRTWFSSSCLLRLCCGPCVRGHGSCF